MEMIRMLTQWFATCLAIVAIFLFSVMISLKSVILRQAHEENRSHDITFPVCPVDQTLKLTVEEALSGIGASKRNDLECRFRSRRQRLRSACARYQLPLLPAKQLIYLEQSRTSVCLLKKIGSQFWLRYRDTYINRKSVIADKKKMSFMGGRTLNFVFVRDPYTRLFSGYMDKLFSANPPYWRTYGKYTVLKSPSRVHRKVKCGYDVTFAEFVNYILSQYDKNRIRDPHFAPIHHQCQFCHRQYKFIGKMETFMDDMLYVSDAIGALHLNKTRRFIDHLKHATEDEIHRNLYNVFARRRKQIENCGVSLIQALAITWRRWQIRGFIEFRFPFPLGDSDDNTTWEKFKESALNARAMSNKQKLSEAKQQALRQAYGTVSIENKHRVKEMFYPQFEMFGYDPMPHYMFGNYSKPVDGFDFFEKNSIFNYA